MSTDYGREYSSRYRDMMERLDHRYQMASIYIEGGVDVLNLQDLVNGVDWIGGKFLGKTCIDLDIDRQKVTVFGTPAEIDRLIRYEVESLSSPAGGLMLTYGWYPGTPLET